VRAGYRVSSTHCNPLGVKTDAPPGVIWDVMRCWALEHPHKRPPDPASYMGRLLAKAPELKADFSRARVRALGAFWHYAACDMLWRPCDMLWRPCDMLWRLANGGFALQGWSAVCNAICLLAAWPCWRQSPRA